MKKIYILIALLVTGVTFAQNPIVKDVGSFDTLKVYDLIEVNLIKSDENKVVLSGEDTDEVQVINKDGKLKIRMELDNIFDGNRTFVEVHYTEIKTIDGNEGAEITSNELIEQDRIEIRTQEGARVRAGLKVNHADIRAVTGGIIEASGQAQSQKLTVNTGGIYEGRDLEGESADVLVQAGGEVEVFASQKIDIKIRAGGDVIVYGNPSEISRKRTFGGRIKIM